MIIFDLFENSAEVDNLEEKTQNPYPPQASSAERGQVHVTLLDRHRSTNMPITFEFEDGAVYRISRVADKAWFLNMLDQYRQRGYENEFFRLMGNHQGFVKLVDLFRHDQDKKDRKPERHGRKTTSSYRKQTDHIDEQSDSANVRTRRILDRMRMQFPQAQTDLEAVLYSLDDTRKKTRKDIKDLSQDIDQAEDSLKAELVDRLKNINNQRANISARVGEIQTSDREQQKIIDRIIKIDQSQQQALDDLERTVTNTSSTPSSRARQDLDVLAKSKSRVEPKKPKQTTRPDKSATDQDPLPGIDSELATVHDLPLTKIQRNRAMAQRQLSLIEPDDEQDLARVAEDKPQLKATHYFRVESYNQDLARRLGLEQDRAGHWVLRQYDRSGSPFDRKYTAAVQAFGKPRTDTLEQRRAPPPRNPVARNVKQSGKGPHRDPRHEQQKGQSKHPKRDREQEISESAGQRVSTPVGTGVLVGSGRGDTVRVKLDSVQGIDGLDTYEFARDVVHDDLNEGIRDTMTESGESYTWTATFDDGSEEKFIIDCDETDIVKDIFARKFPSKRVIKVSTDWRPAGSGSYGYTLPPMPRDNRPTEPFGNPVDRPRIEKESQNIGLRGLGEDKKKPVPTNPDLWSRAKSAAKSKFDVYPSAYANAWAAKWYKAKGGGWRMGTTQKESQLDLAEADPPRKQTKTQQQDPFAANWDDILGPGSAPENLPGPAAPSEPESGPERAAPELRRATQADTLRATQGITPTARMRDIMNRVRDIPAQADAGYPEPDQADVPAVRVDTDNLPRVANNALQAAGVQNPQWHQVANLPGNMSRAIRSLGRMLFGALTRTPTDEIYMVGNVMGQGPNTAQEVNAVAAWIRANGRDLGQGGIDFDEVIPGYEADIRTYDAAGIRWLIVQDEFGRYIYAWPRDASRAIENPDEPGLLR